MKYFTLAAVLVFAGSCVSANAAESKAEQSILVGNATKSIVIEQAQNEGVHEVTITPSGFSVNEIRRLKLDHAIFDAHVSDIDKDGFDEFYFLSKSGGSGGFINVLAFEEGDKNTLVPIKFTYLKSVTMQHGEGYMGHDDYQFKDTTITNSFPLYNPNDKNCCPTGGTRTVVYELKDIAGEPTLIPTRFFGNKVSIPDAKYLKGFSDGTEFVNTRDAKDHSQ